MLQTEKTFNEDIKVLDKNTRKKKLWKRKIKI
jgi:hypothetical protein